MATYWRRVRYDASSPPWELRSEPNRGLVAYATRDFAPGELICVEFPVLWVAGHHPFNSEQMEDIQSKVDDLCDEDKDAFHAMANVFPELPAAVGIFMTNCFDMTDSIYGTCCAMYLALARLNHSCTPNAQQTHLPDTTEEVLYACRAISRGEEINDCYIDLRQTHAKRQEMLLEHYRFTCNCPGCGIEGDARIRDDALRSAAFLLIDELTDIITEDALPNALTKATTFSKTLSTRECLLWSIRYLPELSLCAYEIALTLEQRGMAKKYLQKAHALNVLLQGDRAADSQRTAGLLEKIKKKPK